MLYELKSADELTKEFGDWKGRFTLGGLLRFVPAGTQFYVEPQHIKERANLRPYLTDECYPALYVSLDGGGVLTEAIDTLGWSIVPLKCFKPVYDFREFFECL